MGYFLSPVLACVAVGLIAYILAGLHVNGGGDRSTNRLCCTLRKPVYVEYNVPFLSFVVVSYVPNALWLRRTLFSLSYVNCFRDNSLNLYSRRDR